MGNRKWPAHATKMQTGECENRKGKQKATR